ncbi:MAG: VIT1/CCC1 transporter family protein [Anaerolineales bacterium]
MTEKVDKTRYKANWQKEIDGAALYHTLADLEKNPQMAEVYRRLAQAEEKHAAYWKQRLQEAGIKLPPDRPTWRTRTLSWLACRFGISFILPTITSLERADSQAYDNQPESEALAMSEEEKSHARLLSAASTGSSGVAGGTIAQIEGRHRAGGGNALRAAVLGANDGLVSILSLVMGVAGANLANKDVLIAGLAGLLAGAGSMAMGEWLSVQSSRELYQHQIRIEKEELETTPEEEQEELALIYQSKGLPEDQANKLAQQIIQNKSSALDTLAREELGIDPQELGGSAIEAAVTSFLLFAVGALFPLLPYVFLSGSTAMYVSLIVSALGLFLIGAAITLFTGKSVLYSGTRQVLIGMAAAALTYGVGKLVGVSVG